MLIFASAQIGKAGTSDVMKDWRSNRWAMKKTGSLGYIYIYMGDEILPSYILGGGFKYVLIFTPIWGRFSFWLILTNISQRGWNHQLVYGF